MDRSDIDRQDIAQVLAARPEARHAAAIIRHAQRHPLGSTTDPSKALLTDAGKAAAVALGGRISGFAHLRLFHSPVMRCQQTAECIAEGASSSGMRIELCGARPRLGFVCAKNEPAALTLYTEIGDAFVTRWLSGQLPQGMMEDPSDTVSQNLAEIADALDQATPHGPRLDLHVSHDWNIMVMRELLVGVRHEEVGWLGFLDGLGLWRTADARLQVTYDRSFRIGSLPWDHYVLR